MSELKEMWARHREEIDVLRRTCQHKQLKHTRDTGVVGRGSAWPSHHIVCRNCGTMKIIFIQDAQEAKRKAKLTLKRQPGFKDQRLGCYVQYEHEL